MLSVSVLRFGIERTKIVFKIILPSVKDRIMSLTDEQSIEDQRIFRFLSLISLGLVFTVIIIGAFLSARGQGLLCSDWPLCPTGFTLSPGGEYFIEYIHRVVALITAFSVYATACYSVRRFVKARRPAIATAAAVSFQIALGMIVVYSERDPIIVATHTGVGVISFALSLLSFISSYPISTGHTAPNQTTSKVD